MGFLFLDKVPQSCHPEERGIFASNSTKMVFARDEAISFAKSIVAISSAVASFLAMTRLCSEFANKKTFVKVLNFDKGC